MKRLMSCLSVVFVCLSILFVSMLQVGCEEEAGGLHVTAWSDPINKVGDMIILQVLSSVATNIDANSNRDYGDSVDDVTLTRDGLEYDYTQTFYTYDEMQLPFEWSVSDPSLGSIVAVLDDGIVMYKCTSLARENYVTVRDQRGAEGVEVVQVFTGSSDSLTLTASPETIQEGGASTVTITSESSLSPYSWRLVSGPGSLTGVAGSKSAVYSSSDAGTGIIEVTDANGASGVIGIVVTTESSDGEGGDDG